MAFSRSCHQGVFGKVAVLTKKPRWQDFHSLPPLHVTASVLASIDGPLSNCSRGEGTQGSH